MVGKEILGYHVDEKIGSGGFGTVYKVSKTNAAGTYVRALKHITLPTKKQYASVLNSMGGDYAKADDYFAGVLNDIVSEIRILSTLSESGIQNIVRYYENDIIETQSPKTYDIYILMEYLTPFPDYFESAAFTVKDVIRLGKDILTALVSCHGKNVIHRDIKDDNIFVSSEGIYKLGDFGVSKALKDKSRAESVKGTPNFIAPEVYLGKEKYDNTVDVYSLGIVLYKLLNKQRNPFLPMFPAPYSAGDEDVAFEARMTGKIPELPVMAQNELGAAVVKAILPRAQRYNSAAEFLQALEEAESRMTAQALAEHVGLMGGSAPAPAPTASAGNATPAPTPASTLTPGTPAPEYHAPRDDRTIGTTPSYTPRDETYGASENRGLFETMGGNQTPTPRSNTPQPPFGGQTYNPGQPPAGGYGVPQNGYSAPQNGYGAPPNGAYQQNGYGAPQGGTYMPQGYNPNATAPPQVPAVTKKDLSWLIYLTPLVIAIIYISVFVIAVRRVYGMVVGVFKWMFSGWENIKNTIVDTAQSLEDPDTILIPAGKIIGLQILHWVLVLGFIASIFWVAWTIQNKKPKININARLVGRDAYLTALDLMEQVKAITEQDVTRAQKALLVVHDRLKNDSDFGSGSMTVINCENEIASFMDAIAGNIPGLYNAETCGEAIKQIEFYCQRILSKLRTRTELKKK